MNTTHGDHARDHRGDDARMDRIGAEARTHGALLDGLSAIGSAPDCSEIDSACADCGVKLPLMIALRRGSVRRSAVPTARRRRG